MKDNVSMLQGTDLSNEEKIERFISELTLDEKLHMLASGSDGAERLGIPSLRLGGEAAHGVEARNDQNGIGDSDTTTSFPEPIGMCSSWDTEAIKKAGKTVGEEARVVYAKRKWGGISRWAPTVDLLRDPRWGRNEEAYSEDPVLAGTMATAYIQGMQGDDPEHVVCAATLKHFYANNTEIGRVWKNSSISPRDKYELYLEPFRRCIEDGRAEGVMTAYNRINGVQGLFNDEVNTILKKEFGLTHAVSDGGAMELAAAFSHVTAMDAETVAKSIKAGVDALSGRPDGVYMGAKEAYELGLLSEEDIDNAIRNVYRTKARLGIFDGEGGSGFPAGTCGDEAFSACRDLTDRSVVLLKNDGILPLKDMKAGGCVLIGPVGDKWYQDWYGGAAPEHVSLLDGINGVLEEKGNSDGIRYSDGCDRINLKCGEKYFAVSKDGSIKLSDAPDTFILDDWGEGSFTLRNEASGKYLNTRLTSESIIGIAAAQEAQKDPVKITGRVYCDTDRIFSWFDLEVFRMDEVRDVSGAGNLIMCDRFGNRLYADKDGYIVAASSDSPELTSLILTAETVRCGLDEAKEAAASAGTVILALGHNPMVNAKEEIDRSTIEFIPYQQKLFDEIYKVNSNIVVVLMSDYPFAINELNSKARAIVWSATGSQCMGRSLADVLAGNVHPAGRLTQTWYKSDSDLPDIDDYAITGKGRTYRYFDKDVLYPFGFGLTYTTFEYSDIKVTVDPQGPAHIVNRDKKTTAQPEGVYDIVRADGRMLDIEVTVTNTGSEVSDEVVQIYAKAPKCRVQRPVKQLIGFKRVRDIAPGTSKTVGFKIPVRELAYYDVISEALIIYGGRYEITAAASSAGPGVTADVDIEGAVTGLRDMNAKIKADHFDEETGIQIVEGMYGYSAVTGMDPGVYEPPKDGHIRVTYADCSITENAQSLRIHGIAPGTAEVRVFIDDVLAGSITLNTKDYEKKPSEARNHMPRAAMAEKLLKESWPVLWADILIPLETGMIKDPSSNVGHTISIEADGPFKYDWFSIV